MLGLLLGWLDLGWLRGGVVGVGLDLGLGLWGGWCRSLKAKA